MAPIDSRPHAEPAGGPGPGGRHLGGDGDLEVRPLVGPELEPGVAQREPVGLVGDRLLRAEQLEDGVERLLHHVPLPRPTSMPIMKASDGSAPGPDAEHDPARR